jgi:hypothetical protein
MMAIGLRAALLRITIPLARAAGELVRGKAWFACGFARAEDFARERLGRSGRWLSDLACLQAALEALPGLAAALTGGDGGRPIGRVAALLIGRIASPLSVATWINLARCSTVRDLRAAITRARAAGADSPWIVESQSGMDRHVDQPASSSRPAAGDPARDGASANDGVGDPRAPAVDPADRSLVRIAVPRAVRAAFDEAVDLYRAVEGSEATVTSFVEALVAETSAGDPPADGHGAPGGPSDTDRALLVSGPGQARIESALARSTGNWRHLPEAPAFAPDNLHQLPETPALSPDLALAEESLAALADLERRAGTGEPADLLDQIRALVSLENRLEVALGRLLAGMAEDGAWTRLRFAGIGHYAEERLGLSRTIAEDRARIGRALRGYPRLREAYEGDRLGLEAAMTVARILSDAPAGSLSDRAAVEDGWLARASEATVKRLRDEARLLLRRVNPAGGAGASPAGTDGTSMAARPPVLDPVSDPGPAPFLDPAPDLRSGPPVGGQPHRPVDDAEWHASLRRDPGTARRRILHYGLLAAGMGGDASHGGARTDAAIGFDPGTGSITAPPISPETALIPSPDVFLRLRLPADLAGNLLAAIEAVRRRLAAEAEAVPWDAAWPDGPAQAALPSRLAARTFSTRCRRLPSWVGLLAMLEEFVLTWDAGARGEASGGDRVYARDGWRCTAPGCSSRRNLESHHVVYRSRGGGEGDENMTCLCRFHHQRGEHGGLASCAGTAPLGLTWRLGRAGRLAEWYRNERRLGLQSAPRGPLAPVCPLPGSGPPVPSGSPAPPWAAVSPAALRQDGL